MIGFVGLSHLGLVSSIAVASKGFEVVGFHPDKQLIDDLNAGRLPVYEPGLAELLANSRHRIEFSEDINTLKRCKVVYFSLDVPTDANNNSDLSAFDEMIEQLLLHVSSGTTLVILSQVPPGYTRRWAQRLEQENAGRNLTLFYQVETLIFGRAVERALEPERYIVGCLEPARELPPAYAALLDAFGCPVFKMRYESAELSKISINMCLVSSVTTANTLAEICEAIGADWSEIVPTLRLDKRIGKYAYLAPGLGIAGGNLERDLATIQRLAAEHGSDASIVDAWVAHCRHRRDWVLRLLAREIFSKNADPTIAIWGLAYKQDTKSTKNSPALFLLESLKAFAVRVYDPQVTLPSSCLAGRQNTEKKIVQTGSALEACRGADVLVVMTPWKEFFTIDPCDIANALRGRVIIDPLACIQSHAWRDLGVSYHRLGTSNSREAA
ncbi:MAG: UDP-glucose 6-dehydrogenase [Gemmatales bacterium]|nr:MAG: UDP-glucose 6-dehydrogenase [Gemmatales bacterium]